MKERYYAINLTTYSRLIIKCGLDSREVFEVLSGSRGIKGHAGTIYNLKNYESFYEVGLPDDRTKNMALTLDRIIE
jgi:hypothetical protein